MRSTKIQSRAEKFSFPTSLIAASDVAGVSVVTNGSAVTKIVSTFD